MWTVFASLGNFFRLKWKAILVIMTGILIILGIWHYNSLIENKVRAMIGYQQVQQALQEQKQAFKNLKKEQQRIKRLENKYKQKLENIKEYLRGLRYDIEKIEKNNEIVRNWSNNGAPTYVINKLRKQNSQSNYKNRNKTDSPSKTMNGTN